jgi:peptide/nickel transport system substrate-binding protein
MLRWEVGLHAIFRLALTVTALLWVGPVSAQEAPQRGGTISIGLAQDPPIIDPLRTGTFTERQFARPVYEALFEIDEHGRAVPFLAESYEVRSEGKIYRVKLRRGIQFHDGTPLNADAVVANIERLRSPENNCRCLTQMQDIAEVVAVDEMTVEFRLQFANAAFPTVLADVPGTMVSPTAFRANPSEIGLKPVGTGPFKFKEWIRNSRLIYVRNSNYWKPGRPYLDQVIFRGFQNPETSQTAFLSGQTDIILQSTNRFVFQSEKDSRFSVYKPPGFGYDGVYLNLTQPPFDDVKIRKAIVQATDRELLRQTLEFGVPTLAYSPFGPGMWAHQDVPNYPKYDPAQAKTLVESYGRPVKFALQYNNSPGAQKIAQSLREMWAAVGIQADLQPLDQNRLVQNMSSKQFVASLYRFTGRADPSTNTYQFFHSKFADVTPSSNYTHYKNARVDALLEEGMATSELEERKAIYAKISAILAEDLPYAFLFHPADGVVVNKKIQGFVAMPDGLVRPSDIWIR